MERVFSGVQPTGDIHIGNYLGAMKQFLKFQNNYECLFCIVDLHALTVPQDPIELRNKSIELAKLYLAIGLDPKKVIVFIQSHVHEHSELSWLLQCMTYYGELGRMTQFKEKSTGKKSVSVGLFTYPDLMAADILLYDTNYVPVGEDQKQHLELTKNIAQRFNNKFGETFVIPEPIILDTGSRIMSLTNPLKKMSKSEDNQYSKINLTDSPIQIKKKIMKAVTDSENVIRYDPDNKPGLSNLLILYSVFTDTKIDDVVNCFKGQGYGTFKKELVDVIVEKLSNIQENYKNLDDNYIYEILKIGAEKASEIANVTIKRVKDKMGLIPIM